MNPSPPGMNVSGWSLNELTGRSGLARDFPAEQLVVNRRWLLQRTGLLCLGACLPRLAAAAAMAAETGQHMPDEGARHKRTWMAFGASARIWGRWLLPRVQRDLATIANIIVRYEPVTMLVRADEIALAESLLDPAVEIVQCPMDDLWIRDTGPTFLVADDGSRSAVDFNFNGWGEKQAYRQDAGVAAFVAESADVSLVNTALVLEGGCIEVDGEGTAIITESCVLNDNRNPGVSKAAFEDAIMPLLGLHKIIWLPGIRGMDITDGHTDFYARFVGPGRVVAGYDPDPASFDHAVTLAHLDILRQATDAADRPLAVSVMEGPGTVRREFDSEDFAAGYIGFYLCNDAVILQTFGDKVSDKSAADTLQQLFPDRTIEQIAVDAIAAGGGSVHCTTQQEPLT